MTIDRRVTKLEGLTKTRRARSAKPFTPQDWTATELTSLVNSWPDYPVDLKGKHDLTEWPDAGEDVDTETLVKKLHALADIFAIDVDGIIARLE